MKKKQKRKQQQQKKSLQPKFLMEQLHKWNKYTLKMLPLKTVDCRIWVEVSVHQTLFIINFSNGEHKGKIIQARVFKILCLMLNCFEWGYQIPETLFKSEEFIVI